MRSRSFLRCKEGEGFMIYDLRFAIYAILGASVAILARRRSQENYEVAHHALVAPKSNEGGSRITFDSPR